MKLADILKDSDYKLSQFTTAEIEQLEQSITLKTTKKGDVPQTICLVRQKAIQLTPEEVIRQLYLRVLTDRLHYPLSRIQVEYGVHFGREVKRADIVVMDKDRLDAIYILVELKKPKLRDGKDQCKSYCNATGAPIGVWTNGDQITQYQRKDPNFFEPIPAVPSAHQTLADVLQKRFTLDDLKKIDKENSQQSLKEVIEEMEDEVLANAGVDVFEEVFKLIFTKLYDEWTSGRKGQSGKRQLQFYNSGQTETELKEKIQTLFNAAKKKWAGVFQSDEKITLTGSHLSVCVSYLERRKLFNSNLDVVDEAFEYLINKSSKGEKGQYFTPRYVIDMCVKMLNPKEHESMIDPAAGSSGFPVHTMFHVWRQIYLDERQEPSDMFTAEEKLPRCEDYVEEKVFGIDFDEKAVRVARTLNLIAGDGQTNVLHLNTLDYKRWSERLRPEEEDWQAIYSNGFRRLREFQVQKDDYKAFKFDIVMANPPFAGDIRESLIISSYELTKDKAGKAKGVGRDILFIERNLDFLKPGGRMAIVLPQGRFNNSSDKNIRDFIAERCRILAVVGLHGNTFKPHTGTKTSVLFVQKWNDDPKAGALCPRQDDYNIFFATMQKSGKDNSGEKIYVKDPNNPGLFLLDENHHLIVDHDLFNHEGLTQDGIAEAFIEFAKKEKLSFFEPGPSVTPFDAVRYQQLMDGLEAVEVSLKQVLRDNLPLRIDSEYFGKYYLTNLKIVEKHNYRKINEFAYVTDGIHESIDFDEGSNILSFSAKYPKENYFDLTEIKKISKRQHDLNPRTQFQEDDVIISTVGTIGNCAVVDQSILPANSDRDVGIIRIQDKSVKPRFLSTFLVGKYGRFQSERESTGNVQLHLFIYKIKEIKVPKLEIGFQENIEGIVKLSKALLDSSKEIYQQAEDLLLSELGLQDWQPTEETVAVKSFAESFLSSGRLDAEYYQSKYYEVEAKIKDKGFVLAQDICSHINYGSVPTSPYTENNEGTPYIKGLNLKNTEIVTDQLDRIINTQDLPSKVFTEKGDIIISQMGTVGNCGVVESEHSGWIFASFTIRIRLKKSVDFNPYFIALYIEKVAKPYYLMRNVAQASVRQNTDLPTIKNIYIPKISNDTPFLL